MSRHTAAPWHAGERAVHARVGETALADRIEIGATVPPAAIEFLAEQSIVYVAAVAGDHVWVTPLTGDPGFATVTGLRQIAVAARPPDDDPLATALAGPTLVGAIAIEPSSRRRMRFNGQSTPTSNGIAIELDQVYSNCPRFIQKREPGPRGAPQSGSRAAVSTGRLSERQVAWLSAADTFLIGTADAEGNADASHRGGSAGFVKVVSPTRFRFPDYAGNHMYMTLGNLDVRTSAGFVFIDWSTGDVLQVTGNSVVEFDSAAAAAEFPGAARVVDVTVARVVEGSGRLAAQWSAPEPSRFNPPARHEGA